MNELVKEEVEQLISKYDLDCSVEEFKRKASGVDHFGGIWLKITLDDKLSEDFIREYPDRVQWFCLGNHYRFSDKFIEDFKSEINWKILSWNNEFPDSFLDKYKDRIFWDEYCYKHECSETTIRKFRDYIVWWRLLETQSFSDEFLSEFVSEFDIEWLIENEVLSQKEIDRLKRIKVEAGYGEVEPKKHW
ncbi:MAG TPA: hypothetical protein VMZ91_04045 [Candidatus Paceibacterota bacterium]|nr:hypothetical protein [Candidatus Paceibacterota bacterium]